MQAVSDKPQRDQGDDRRNIEHAADRRDNAAKRTQIRLNEPAEKLPDKTLANGRQPRHQYVNQYHIEVNLINDINQLMNAAQYACHLILGNSTSSANISVMVPVTSTESGVHKKMSAPSL